MPCALVISLKCTTIAEIIAPYKPQLTDRMRSCSCAAARDCLSKMRSTALRQPLLLKWPIRRVSYKKTCKIRIFDDKKTFVTNVLTTQLSASARMRGKMPIAAELISEKCRPFLKIRMPLASISDFSPYHWSRQRRPMRRDPLNGNDAISALGGWHR